MLTKSAEILENSGANNICKPQLLEHYTDCSGK